MTDSLLSQARGLETWLREKALPYWAENGRDARGGWYEHLLLDGSPDPDAIRRLRVQARQVYVYALADKMGWYDGREIVESSFAFMRDYGFEKGGKPGFIHLLKPDYNVHNPKRDLYDHAFYLLASLWAGQPDMIDKIQSFIATLASPQGGWAEGAPATLPRRQNPHMHMFEAALHGYDITGEAHWVERAKGIFELFKTRFFDPQYHIVREFFDADWTVSDGALGETAEPGHAVEWVWLLWMFERRTDIDTSDYARKLYDKALENGNRFLNDEEDITGAPRRETKRLWVQTELIKAHLAQTERGDKSARDKAANIIAKFRNTYLKESGTWVDQIDATGTPIADTIPTSTFYHIICMIYEAQRVAKLT